MGPVLIVEVLELPERVQEVALVPDEREVQELVPACLHPAFHDRIHQTYRKQQTTGSKPGPFRTMGLITRS